MRVHRNLAEAVVETLYRIFNKEAYADKALEKTLQSNKRWGSRDRAFIAESTYEIVRWKRLYYEAVEASVPLTRDKLYRMLFVYLSQHGFTLPDWEEFKGLSEVQISKRLTTLRDTRSIRESIPDWLDKLAVDEMGEERWTREIEALNKPAKVVLRTNTLKTNRKELQQKLDGENVSTHVLEIAPEALILQKRAKLGHLQSFKEGLFEVQDTSSQLVAHFADLKPGMQVLDACAGAGGKSLHMASIMENKGHIIALDVHGKKLRELQKRAMRNGISIIETLLIKNKEQLQSFEDLVDIVLIDAPCSGLGILKRKPDTKWKLSPKFIDQCKDLQKSVLRDYSKAVKPGGQLVYVTCSILPGENSDQISWFLESDFGRGFKFEAEKEIWPSEIGYDGFYMAKLIRSN